MQPDRTALGFLGQTTTWSEFDRRVTTLGDALSRCGVRFGDRVMTLMINRTEFVETFLAAKPVGRRRGSGELPAHSAGDRVPGGGRRTRVMNTEPVLAGIAAADRDLAPLGEGRHQDIIVAGAPTDDRLLGYDDKIAEPVTGAEVPHGRRLRRRRLGHRAR